METLTPCSKEIAASGRTEAGYLAAFCWSFKDSAEDWAPGLGELGNKCDAPEDFLIFVLVRIEERKIGRRGVAGKVDAILPVHRDCLAIFPAVSAEVSGVVKRSTVRAHFRQEGCELQVVGAIRRLVSAAGDREVS